MGQILPLAVVLVAVAFAATYLLNQLRKPTRWIGRLFARAMGVSHSALTDWGLTHVRVGKTFAILDVGCGSGRALQKLAAMAVEGRLHGIDHAEGSVAAARKTNAPLIRSGRVEIRLASVSALPFQDGTFDLVTAIETQYYWSDLAHDMREIRRVLKPGGTLLVIADDYASRRYNPLEAWVMRLSGARALGIDEERELFTAAGYGEVQVFEEQRNGWLCVMGRKP